MMRPLIKVTLKENDRIANEHWMALSFRTRLALVEHEKMHRQLERIRFAEKEQLLVLNTTALAESRKNVLAVKAFTGDMKMTFSVQVPTGFDMGNRLKPAASMRSRKRAKHNAYRTAFSLLRVIKKITAEDIKAAEDERDAHLAKLPSFTHSLTVPPGFVEKLETLTKERQEVKNNARPKHSAGCGGA